MNSINFKYASTKLAELERETYQMWKSCDIPELQASLEKAHLAVIEAREELAILKNNNIDLYKLE